MNFRTTRDFPKWVHDYQQQTYDIRKGWPKEYQPIADEIFKKADELAEIWYETRNDSPYTTIEVSNYMGARVDYYESYPIFACNKGFRPDDWDILYDSERCYNFSRTGSFYEAKIGDWYFLVGFDFD